MYITFIDISDKNANFLIQFSYTMDNRNTKGNREIHRQIEVRYQLGYNAIKMIEFYSFII